MKVVAACLLAAALVVVGAAQSGASARDGERVATITDDRVPESSGLAVSPSDRSLLYTINDSDNTAAIYAIDRSTGDVVGETTVGGYDLSDTEALGMGSDGTLWVADIGDNSANRSDIALYAFPEPGRGDSTVTPTRFPLRYPNGPQDAEALLVKPRTHRILIVSKGVTDGSVYAAPRKLRADRPNDLRRVRRADAPGLVTDGSFTPDGDRVVLRTYGNVVVYDAQTWDETSSDGLPAQRQGESMAVDRDGKSILIGTEGLPSPILRVDLPQPDRTQPTEQEPKADDTAASKDEARLATGLKIVGALGVVLVVLVVWIIVAARRSRRRHHAMQ